MSKKSRDGKLLKHNTTPAAGGAQTAPVQKIEKLTVKISDYLDNTPFLLNPTSGAFFHSTAPGFRKQGEEAKKPLTDTSKSALFFCSEDGDVAAVPKEMLLNPTAEYEDDDTDAPAMIGMEINAAQEEGARGGVCGVAHMTRCAAYPLVVAALTEEEEVIPAAKPKGGKGKKKQQQDEIREIQTLGFYAVDMEKTEMRLLKTVNPVEVSMDVTSVQWSPCGRFIVAQACQSIPVERDENEERDEEDEDEEEETDDEIMHSVELFKVNGVPSVTKITKVFGKDEMQSACFLDLSSTHDHMAKRDGPCLLAVYNHEEGAVEIHNFDDTSKKPGEAAHVLDTDLLFPSAKLADKNQADDEEDEEEEEEEPIFKSLAAVDRFLIVREIETCVILEISVDKKDNSKIKSEVIGRVPIADDGDNTDVIDTMPFVLARGVAPFPAKGEPVVPGTQGITNNRSDVVFGVAFSDSRNILVFGHRAGEKLKVVDLVNLREDERPRSVLVEGGNDNVPLTTTLENPLHNAPAIAVLIEVDPEADKESENSLSDVDPLETETVVRLLTLTSKVVEEVQGGAAATDEDEDEDAPDPMANCYGKYECTAIPAAITYAKKEDFCLTLTPLFGVPEEEELEDLELRQSRWSLSRTEKIVNAKGGKGEDSLLGSIIGTEALEGVPPRYWIEWGKNLGTCKISSFVSKIDSWNVDMKAHGKTEKEMIKSLTRKLPTGSNPKPTIRIETENGFVYQGPK